MADAVRLQIAADMLATLQASPSVGDAEYSRPQDFSRPRMPYGWVYDFEEATDEESFTGEDWSEVRFAAQVSFLYDQNNPTTLQQLGNNLLGELKKQFRLDRTRSGLAWDTFIEANAILDLADRQAGLGLVMLIVSVRYITKTNDPTTPMG